VTITHLREAAISLAGPLAELRCRPATTKAEHDRLWAVNWAGDLNNARRYLTAAELAVLIG
jgi:hypothetical protein